MRAAPRHTQSRRIAAAAAWLLLGFASDTARAVDCTPETANTSCLDANSLWLRPTEQAFVAVGTRIPDASTGVFTGHTSYLYRPIVVVAPSPDPSGRDITVAEHVVGLTLGGTYAPTPGVAVGLSAPWVPFQSGNGLAGITTTTGPDLESPALRDPRMHAALEILDVPHSGLAWLAGLDVAVPLGSAGRFAGERGPSAAPFTSLQGRRPWWFWGVELGARLRSEVEFAGTRFGHQGVVTGGAGLKTTDDAFGLAAEFWARPSLLVTERSSPSGEHIDEWPISAEWMVSGWADFGEPRLGSFQLGIGGGIPLGRRTVESTSGQTRSEGFTAPGSPALRVLLGIRLPIPRVY